MVAEERCTRLNLTDSDGSVDEFSEEDTVECVDGVFGRAVDTTWSSGLCCELTYLQSMVLAQR